MSLLRMVGACFWVGCGWLGGDWICVRVRQHLEDFQNLSPPESFSAQEAACFRACVSGLGRTEAVQECERLRLYILRFEAFRAESGQLAQTRVSLSRRLGLGAGLAAAIFFL